MDERWWILGCCTIIGFTLAFFTMAPASLVQRLTGTAGACLDQTDHCTHLDIKQFNLLFSTSSWASAFGAIFAGFITDHFGCRLALFGSSLFVGLGGWVSGPATSCSACIAANSHQRTFRTARFLYRPVCCGAAATEKTAEQVRSAIKSPPLLPSCMVVGVDSMERTGRSKRRYGWIKTALHRQKKRKIIVSRKKFFVSLIRTVKFVQASEKRRSWRKSAAAAAANLTKWSSHLSKISHFSKTTKYGISFA